ALSPRPTLSLLEQALGAPCDLSPAFAANVATLEGGRVSFTHPLFPTWITGQIDATAQAALHRRLAELAGDPEERAHHLALRVTVPRRRGEWHRRLPRRRCAASPPPVRRARPNLQAGQRADRRATRARWPVLRVQRAGRGREARPRHVRAVCPGRGGTGLVRL